MVRSELHDILATGVAEEASDWHIREGSTVVVRIHGKLVEMDFSTDRDYLHEAVKQITTPRLLKEYEDTGDADFAFEEENVGRFRVNLHKQRGKMALTFRHVRDETPDIVALGLPEALYEIAEHRNGIVFVTGITGSGKSTTLAGMIGHMNEKLNHHIVTVEDPIEYTFDDKNCVIEQREVGLDAITFSSALIHVLRQDPDVIVVGEMRNRETFETALTAAETGHLVLTTLHTTSASQSIIRIMDMYPSEEQESVRKSLSQSLRAIICQRLVAKAAGDGVVPAVEIMINTPIVRKLIYENRLDKLAQAIDAGGEDGMMSFNRCLLRLVDNGVITEETALASSDNPQALEMNLKGIFLSTDGAGIIT